MISEAFITCAVAGAGDTVARSEHVPVTPDQIAESALDAARAAPRPALDQARRRTRAEARLLDQVAGQSDDQAGDRSVAELERERDDCLVAILQALFARDTGAGATLAGWERDLMGRSPASGAASAANDGAGEGAPLALMTREIPPDWLDYNGHVTESQYLRAVRRRDRRAARLHRRRRRVSGIGRELLYAVRPHPASGAAVRRRSRPDPHPGTGLGRQAPAPVPRPDQGRRERPGGHGRAHAGPRRRNRRPGLAGARRRARAGRRAGQGPCRVAATTARGPANRAVEARGYWPRPPRNSMPRSIASAIAR